MFDIGFQELIVIFIVVLLVFGPKRLPELARTIGKGMGEMKKALSGVQEEISKEVRMAEMEQYVKNLDKDRKTGEEVRPESPKEDETSSGGETPPSEKIDEGQPRG